MSAYKIRTPGNYPEESIKQCAFCWCLLHRYITMHGWKNVNCMECL